VPSDSSSYELRGLHCEKWTAGTFPAGRTASVAAQGRRHHQRYPASCGRRRERRRARAAAKITANA